MKRPKKPIRVFYSSLSGNFYASNQYREGPEGVFRITGRKDDVTQDIAHAVITHDVVFREVAPPSPAVGDGKEEG